MAQVERHISPKMMPSDEWNILQVYAVQWMRKYNGCFVAIDQNRVDFTVVKGRHDTCPPFRKNRTFSCASHSFHVWPSISLELLQEGALLLSYLLPNVCHMLPDMVYFQGFFSRLPWICWKCYVVHTRESNGSKKRMLGGFSQLKVMIWCGFCWRRPCADSRWTHCRCVLGNPITRSSTCEMVPFAAHLFKHPECLNLPPNILAHSCVFDVNLSACDGNRNIFWNGRVNMRCMA